MGARDQYALAGVQNRRKAFGAPIQGNACGARGGVASDEAERRAIFDTNATAFWKLPPAVKAVAMAKGALTNSHVLAIPFNTSARAGAKVVANFLLSPAAQALIRMSQGATG